MKTNLENNYRNVDTSLMAPIYLEDLPYTAHIPSIKKAVHSNNPLIYKKIVSNPRLDESDCRHLIPLLHNSTMLRAILIEHEAFPSDLLSELATLEEDKLVRHSIANNPNTLPEDAVLSLLRGTLEHGEYIRARLHQKSV